MNCKDSMERYFQNIDGAERWVNKISGRRVLAVQNSGGAKAQLAKLDCFWLGQEDSLFLYGREVPKDAYISHGVDMLAWWSVGSFESMFEKGVPNATIERRAGHWHARVRGVCVSIAMTSHDANAYAAVLNSLTLRDAQLVALGRAGSLHGLVKAITELP